MSLHAVLASCTRWQACAQSCTCRQLWFGGTQEGKQPLRSSHETDIPQRSNPLLVRCRKATSLLLVGHMPQRHRPDGSNSRSQIRLVPSIIAIADQRAYPLSRPTIVTPTTRPGELWHVYIVCCADGSLYTGIAKDLERRLAQHNTGTASRYTRSRLPVGLAYQQQQLIRSAALKRELAINTLS